MPATVLSGAFSSPAAPLGVNALEADVQAYMEAVASALVSATSSIILCGRPSRPSFGTRKPDLPGIVAVDVPVLSAAMRGSAVAADAGASVTSSPSAPRTPASSDAAHVVVVGELKRRRPLANAGVFSDEEKGDTLSFVQDLVAFQPWRALAHSSDSAARVVAFLCDGWHIVFFQCILSVRVAEAVVVSITSVLETPQLLLRGDGGRFLEGLTLASLPSLGYALPSFRLRGRPVEHLQFAGLGATACVFGGALGDLPSVAVKQYFRGRSDVTAQEESALTQVRGIPGFIQLIGRADSPSSTPAVSESCAGFAPPAAAIILGPLGLVKYSLRAIFPQSPPCVAGRLFDCNLGASSLRADVTRACLFRPGAAEYCDLVDALARLHLQGLVHRDPRPDNFFRTADGQFFLADLGSSARIGDVAWDRRPWGFPYGPLEVLRAMSRAEEDSPASAAASISITCSAAHDFEQVARLVYAAQSRVVDALPVHTPGNMKDIVAFWDSVGHLEPLVSLLAAASAAAATCALSPDDGVASASAAVCPDSGRELLKVQIMRVLL